MCLLWMFEKDGHVQWSLEHPSFRVSLSGVQVRSSKVSRYLSRSRSPTTSLPSLLQSANCKLLVASAAYLILILYGDADDINILCFLWMTLRKTRRGRFKLTLINAPQLRKQKSHRKFRHTLRGGYSAIIALFILQCTPSTLRWVQVSTLSIAECVLGSKIRHWWCRTLSNPRQSRSNPSLCTANRYTQHQSHLQKCYVYSMSRGLTLDFCPIFPDDRRTPPELSWHTVNFTPLYCRLKHDGCSTAKADHTEASSSSTIGAISVQLVRPCNDTPRCFRTESL